MWVDIREPVTEKLLMRYDPQRDIIEVQRRGVKTVVDLTQYKERQGAPDERTKQAPVLRDTRQLD